jgi:hypothetical protein
VKCANAVGTVTSGTQRPSTRIVTRFARHVVLLLSGDEPDALADAELRADAAVADHDVAVVERRRRDERQAADAALVVDRVDVVAVRARALLFLVVGDAAAKFGCTPLAISCALPARPRRRGSSR